MKYSIIHWMITDYDFESYEIKGPPLHEVWKNMETLKEQGLIKSIGVSNWGVPMFIDLWATTKHKPAVNQIESNPVVAQSKLVGFTSKLGCVTTAYAPIEVTGFSGSSLLDHETLKQIADKHSVTTVQVSLAWNIARGVAVIPKSLTKERIKENFEALQLKLDDEDMSALSGLEDNSVREFNPESWKGWNYLPYYA